MTSAINWMEISVIILLLEVVLYASLIPAVYFLKLCKLTNLQQKTVMFGRLTMMPLAIQTVNTIDLTRVFWFTITS